MRRADTEGVVLAREIESLVRGQNWHGPTLEELLEGVSAEAASARLVPGAHTIWDLVLHVTAWTDVFRRRIEGTAAEEPEEGDFPPPPPPSAAAWEGAKRAMLEAHDGLAARVAGLSAAALSAGIPGRPFDVRFQARAAIRHSVYHSGQIGLLKRSAPSGSAAVEAIRAALKSQYHAALAMLRQAIELTPDSIWSGTEHRNQVWQIAYHTLFFAHLYGQTREAAFRPWQGHVADVQHPDGIPGPADPKSSLPLIADPYAKAQVLEYWRFCDGQVDSAVDAIDVLSEDSGFWWYRMSKLEHQLVNLRHIQHGAAQIADRVRAAADVGVQWVGGGQEPDAEAETQG